MEWACSLMYLRSVSRLNLTSYRGMGVLSDVSTECIKAQSYLIPWNGMLSDVSTKCIKAQSYNGQSRSILGKIYVEMSVIDFREK